MKPSIKTITLLALSLLVVSCGSIGQKKASTETVHVKAQVMPYITFAPFFIAQEEGFFTEQGLEVEFVQFDSLSQAIPVLVQGDVDVLGGHIRASIFTAIASEAPIKIVADKGYVNPTGCSDTAFITSEPLVKSGELKGPDSLAGKRVSADLTNYEGYLLDAILASGGLTLDDIILVEDMPSSNQSEALKNDALDLVFSAEPWLTRNMQAGNAVIWEAPKYLIPDFQYGVLLYGPSLLEENPEAGKRFMTAYLEGIRQYNQGKTTRNQEIIAKYTSIEPEILEAACWPSFRQDGSINMQSVLDFQEWAKMMGYLEKTVSSDQLWEPLFTDAASLALKVNP